MSQSLSTAVSTADRIDCGFKFSPANGAQSIGFWFYCTAIPASTRFLASREVSTAAFEREWSVRNTGQLSSAYKGGTTAEARSANSAGNIVVVSTWHFIVMTLSSTFVPKQYMSIGGLVPAAEVAYVTQTTGVTITTDAGIKFRIGNNGEAAPASSVAGRYAMVFYMPRRELTLKEIQNIQYNGLSGELEDACEGIWYPGRNGSLVVYDCSGMGNYGIVTGAALNSDYPRTLSRYDLESGEQDLFNKMVVAGGAFTLDAAPGSYVVTGAAADLLAARMINAAPGSYALTGSPASLLAGYVISANSGVYDITGAIAGLLAGRAISADPGSYALTGVAASLLAARLLAADPGSYLIIGADTTLIFTSVGNFVLSADAGIYAITGADAALLADRLLAANAGGYVLTGADAAPLAGRAINAEPGVYAITGLAAALIADRMMSANPGAYNIQGEIAALLATVATFPGHGVSRVAAANRAYSRVSAANQAHTVILNGSLLH